MKAMSDALYNACAYCEQHPEISMTKAGQLFKVSRHSIARNLYRYKEYIYPYKGKHFKLTEKEQISIDEYNNSVEPLTLGYISRKYHTKGECFLYRLKVCNVPYRPYIDRKYNRNAFDEIRTEEDAYWLGFLLADGYVHEKKGILRLKLGAIDREHIVKFAKYMKEEDIYNSIKTDLGGAYTRDNLCYYISFSCKQIVNNLKKFGIFQHKSEKEVPIEFDDFELKKAYVRGMIDGDGCLSKNILKFVGSYASCQYVKDYLSYWIDYKPECKYIMPYGTIFCFTVSNKQVHDALEDIYLGSTVYLDRKYKIVEDYKIAHNR